jgi:chitin disaccharide deacetylase
VKHLIVNADDFGLAPGINEGIVEAHERGIVTSASLMVRQPAAAQAAAWARSHPRLGLGLHIDLWEQVWRDGRWVRLYAHVADEAAAVAQEVQAQLDAFRALVGHDPDHLDTHQHVHRREPVRTVVESLARQLGLPLRGDGTARYIGGFYGQDDVGGPYPEGTGVPRLLELLDALEPGLSEFGCHPGRVAEDEPLGGTVYRLERNTERETLCDPRVLERVGRGDIVLGTFADARR